MFNVTSPLLRSVTWEDAFEALVIIGPTASGKTNLSMELAERGIPLEVISVDAFQVYRGMDIGTAKASLEERTRVPHHMIDVREVHERYNIVDFLHGAAEAIHLIREKGALPVFVGGSLFYVERLFLGAPPTMKSDPNRRALLEDRKNREGICALYEELKTKDPKAADSLSRRDAHKIIRALEIIEVSGRALSELQQVSSTPPSRPLLACVVQLREEREVTRTKVLKRCEAMIQSGLIQEVEQLVERGLKKAPIAASAIGYKEFIPFIEQEISWEESVMQFKKASCSLIKKQMTWLRSREKLFCPSFFFPREDSSLFLHKVSSWKPNSL